MKTLSRRNWLATGIGFAGLTTAARLAPQYGFVPPDASGPYGPGNALSYAANRIFAQHAMAREFPRSQISLKPFANPTSPLGDHFASLQAAGFEDWRLTVDGMVAEPLSLSISTLRSMPQSSHITSLQCEEGWNYIAEWTGVPLSQILQQAGALPQARYVVYRSFQSDWWDSLDIDEARHSQTLVALDMNGNDIPVPFGGPLRLRVPRQLGYKSLKFLNSLTLTDDLKQFGKGLGAASPEFGYSWYAGI